MRLSKFAKLIGSAEAAAVEDAEPVEPSDLARSNFGRGLGFICLSLKSFRSQAPETNNDDHTQHLRSGGSIRRSLLRVKTVDRLVALRLQELRDVSKEVRDEDDGLGASGVGLDFIEVLALTDKPQPFPAIPQAIGPILQDDCWSER
jgi:hypothetical protein